MKKVAVGCFAVVCVIAVLVTILASIGQMRQEKIRQRPPLTRQDLDRLSKTLQDGGAPAEHAATPLTAPVESSGETATDLLRRLNQPPTEEQRRELFTRGKGRLDRLRAMMGRGPLGGIADIKAIAAGRPAGASWWRAEGNLTGGNWEAARSYFAEYLRDSDVPALRQRACAYLAWLEDDPEMAARYMELACSGDEWLGILLSVELATATGSKELAERYTARGRLRVPDFDKLQSIYGRFAKGR